MSHLERIRVPAAMSASGPVKVVSQKIPAAHLKMPVRTDDKAEAKLCWFLCPRRRT